jgi:hypothetical protein
MSLVMTRFRLQTKSLLEEVDKIRHSYQQATDLDKKRTMELLSDNAKLQEQLAKSREVMKLILREDEVLP